MSDESSIPAYGRQPEYRRTGNDAPPWWVMLNRADLPREPRPDADDDLDFGVELPQSLRQVSGLDGDLPSDNRAWLINLAVLLAATALVVAGISIGAAGDVAVAAMVIGIPLVAVVVFGCLSFRRT